MVKEIILIFWGLLFTAFSFSQTYPNNEDGQFEDMLTPEYYNTPDGGAFRLELNKFVHFARDVPFQNPLMDSTGQLASYIIRRSFGDGIGPGGTGSHHPAFDYYIGSNATRVNLYAAFDGYVTINKDADRYRQYLSISTDIKDDSETVIGKMVAIYGHVDLDLDIAADLELDGQYVSKGDLVSQHLYSETVGGPHLHFELRYYRTSDTGTEDFYGGPIGGKTSPSSGIWTNGFWNPNAGYGFAHPENHLRNLTSVKIKDDFKQELKYYPNPVKNIITIEPGIEFYELSYSVYNLLGKEVLRTKMEYSKLLKLDLTGLEPGFYIIVLSEENSNKTLSIRVIKE